MKYSVKTSSLNKNKQERYKRKQKDTLEMKIWFNGMFFPLFFPLTSESGRVGPNQRSSRASLGVSALMDTVKSRNVLQMQLQS